MASHSIDRIHRLGKEILCLHIRTFDFSFENSLTVFNLRNRFVSDVSGRMFGKVISLRNFPLGLFGFSYPSCIVIRGRRSNETSCNFYPWFILSFQEGFWLWPDITGSVLESSEARVVSVKFPVNLEFWFGIRWYSYLKLTLGFPPVGKYLRVSCVWLKVYRYRILCNYPSKATAYPSFRSSLLKFYPQERHTALLSECSNVVRSPTMLIVFKQFIQ